MTKTNETSRAFSKWIDTFVSEKGIDSEKILEVEANATAHFIPVGCVVEAMKSANKVEQAGIKTTIVKIDFCNGDVLHFFRHLATGLASRVSL